MKKMLTFGLVAVICIVFVGCKPRSAAETQHENNSPSENELAELMPMVQVNGVTYFDTGTESTITGRCGTYDGEIESCVDSTQIPTEDNQSNFGTGYGYQFGRKGTIEVLIDGKWIVFEADETNAICGYPLYKDPGETAANTVVQIEDGKQQEVIPLSDEDAVMLTQMIENDNWVDDVTKCASDYIVCLNGRTLFYHSSCGTFNESMRAAAQSSVGPHEGKSLRLSEDETKTVNAMLNKYLVAAE